MFCTTVIPTIGRPTLNRAVQSVLDQSLPGGDFQVIVVNDSGQPLSEQSWQDCNRVSIFETNRRRQTVARNLAAAVAGGRYLHFLDDDDWMLPGAFQEFRTLANAASNASWLYAGTRFVDRSGAYLFDLQRDLQGNILVQLMAGTWIPLQTSIIRTDAFFAAGGFDSAIPVGEDLELSRRIALYGEFACSPAIVGCYSHGLEGSSGKRHLSRETDLAWRERILNAPEAYTRMRSSAHSAYWVGRVVRSYLGSAAWNFRRSLFLTAISRLFCALRALISAGLFVFNSEFWRALVQTNRGFV